MKICVIGLGYIGLPTAAMFASAGHQVLGVDKNPVIVEALNRGEITIEEPGLAEFVRKQAMEGRLSAATDPEAADAFIIAVPTPITEDKHADMRFVEAATASVAPHLKQGDIVVLESTSPVGTVDELMVPILEKTGLKAGRDFYLGHSPERVIPGHILYELVHNSRIAGGLDTASAEKIRDLYKSFVEGEIYTTDSRTAEMAKLTENTYRDINIAFANELAKIAENLNIDVWELISLCNQHPRVNIHQPGPGVGGHCIAVDPWFIVEKQPETAKLILNARQINDSMPEFVCNHILDKLNGISDAKVTVLGVTYKPDVDDVRESPVLKLIAMLEEKGIAVSVHDPHAKGYETDLLQAAAGADILLLGVNHKEYAELPAEALADVMRRKIFFDTRGTQLSAVFETAGFESIRLGVG